MLSIFNYSLSINKLYKIFSKKKLLSTEVEQNFKNEILCESKI